jgi:arginyl-tRNA--protein-N-Asp/Glu arginylyltransferase
MIGEKNKRGKILDIGVLRSIQILKKETSKFNYIGLDIKKSRDINYDLHSFSQSN